METFTIWHHHFDVKLHEFSFFATAAQTQGLNKGTGELIRKMLDDMGLKATIKSWKLDRLATDYLSDHGDSDDWQDIWMETGDIRVVVDGRIRHKPDPPGFDTTTAYDTTWKGKSPPPSRCLVIADFKTRALATKAHRMFERLSEAGKADDVVATVKASFPRVAKRGLDQIGQDLGAGGLSATRCHDPLQVHVAIPAGRAFFEKGAARAVAVEELCHAIGGTTQWRDRYV